MTSFSNSDIKICHNLERRNKRAICYLCYVKQTLKQKLSSWLQPRLRLYAIYRELGYIPWRKPRKPRKVRKEGKGVYIGVKEAIPFVNGDAKRTFSHLLFRPGYLMRDYILRGEHEKYLAPFTALLVFYSFFTLLVAVVQPKEAKESFGDALLRGFKDATLVEEKVDSLASNARGDRFLRSLFGTMQATLLITRLDKYPEAVDTPWKESLAAFEGDLRSKGIPLFLGNFLVMWMVMAILLRKRGISFSGAAAASAYVLCQFCIFMFLALLVSLGQSTELGVVLMGVLLFIDYRQLLGLKNKPAFWLTVKTGLWFLLVCILLFILLGVTLVLLAYIRMG